jgi:hypothetical protein
MASLGRISSSTLLVHYPTVHLAQPKICHCRLFECHSQTDVTGTFSCQACACEGQQKPSAHTYIPSIYRRANDPVLAKPHSNIYAEQI